MIIGMQLIGIVFSFSMIYFAVLHFKKGEISIIEILIWIFAWIFAIVATIFPDILKIFARTFLFARLFDMMVVGSILLVIAMTARTYLTTRKLENKIEKIVRDDAIRNATNKKS